MTAFSFISLLFLGALYLSWKTTEEIPQILALSLLFICCVFALVLAPWELQLILLLLILVSTRNLYKTNLRQSS